MIVSAFFDIPSKRKYATYIPYLKRWFRAISSPVIFFTSDDIREHIEGFGYDLSHIQFQSMEIEDWSAWKLGREFWERQCERDEYKQHTPELAAIWYEKKEFVKRAFELCDAEVLIWCDAGCVRDDACEDALKEFGKRQRQNLNDDKIHLQDINQLSFKEFYAFPDVRIAGAVIVGNRKAWREFETLYNEVLIEYDRAGHAGNMDQYIILSCYDRKNSLFSLHTPNNSLYEWFFFLGYL